MSMTLPVVVEEKDGAFVASVLGTPELRALADTREVAVASLQADVAGRVARGELTTIAVPADAPSTLSAAEEAEAWRELSEDIYRERDAQKAAVVAEYDRT